jgi:two-component system chemotaxis response regulator CheB
MISRIRVITHPRIRLRNPGNANGSVPPVVPSSTAYNALWNAERADLIAIGASTGGPAALAQILGALPADFPVPALIVIHIAEPFAPALAEWLATQSRLPVRYARDGEAVPSGPSVLLAPATHHLVVQNHRIHYSSAAPRHSCKPSVDVLFESLADAYGSSLIACLLTGMGKDGATGLLQARNAGALTIAQDENTSVVYGMPGEAARIGAAERILPLEEIAPAITAAVRRAKGKQ